MPSRMIWWFQGWLDSWEVVLCTWVGLNCGKSWKGKRAVCVPEELDCKLNFNLMERALLDIEFVKSLRCL